MTAPSIAIVAAAMALAMLVWPTRAHASGPAMPRVALREWVHRRRAATAFRERVDRELPVVLSGTAAALRAGLGVGAALAVAADHTSSPATSASRRVDRATDPWAELVETARTGSVLTPLWRSLAERCDSAEVGLVAGAWELTETGGTPLVDALSALSALLDQRARHRRAVEVARAGPRASTRVLLLLPLVGPVAALALGVDPIEMYLGSPIAIGSVLVGIGFAAAGMWWTRRMVAGRLR